MKSPITDLLDDGDSESISLFDRLPDWKSKLSIRMVAGFAERKNLLVAEAQFEPTNSGASSFCPNASESRRTPCRDQDK